MSRVYLTDKNPANQAGFFAPDFFISGAFCFTFVMPTGIKSVYDENRMALRKKAEPNVSVKGKDYEQIYKKSHKRTFYVLHKVSRLGHG